MEKINIANLLKGCPTGMELDSPMYDNLYFDKVEEDYRLPISCYTMYHGSKTSVFFTEFGSYNEHKTSKCVIFPKGKKSWEGFHRPFKDGDIIYNRLQKKICIYYLRGDEVPCIKGCRYNEYNTQLQFETLEYPIPIVIQDYRFATEEEKAKLFKTIKDRGYKWNSKTKTLEILIEPKFKVGDWVTNGICKVPIHFITDTHYWYSANCILGSLESVDKQYHLWTINDAKDGDVLFHSDSASNGIFIFKEILQLGTLQKVICYCDYDSEDGFCLGENHTCCWADSKILRPATEERRNRLFQKMKEAGYKWNAETKTLEKLVEPNFNVGAIIQDKDGYKVRVTEVNIEDECYGYESVIVKGIGGIAFREQDNWKLVPNKFDINTLKPFAKVLVRNHDKSCWDITFYKRYDSTYKPYPYHGLGGVTYKQCIPYEGNEHLFDKNDKCDNFYNTWEE